MQNFGRGMWRRVGDYERIQTPQLLKQTRLQKYLAYIEYQKALKRDDDIKKSIEQTLQRVNSSNQDKAVIETKEEKYIHTNFEVIAIEDDILDMEISEKVSEDINCEVNRESIVALEEIVKEQVISEPLNIIPKKIHKKNKNKK